MIKPQWPPWKSKIRSKKSEIRSEKSEIRSEKSEIRSDQSALGEKLIWTTRMCELEASGQVISAEIKLPPQMLLCPEYRTVHASGPQPQLTLSHCIVCNIVIIIVTFYVTL